MAYSTDYGLIALMPTTDNGKSKAYVIPPSMIKLSTYQVTWESQDYAAYRDANGLLHRTPIASRPPKVEFQVRNGMTGSELSALMTAIRGYMYTYHGTSSDENPDQYLGKKERAYLAKIYVPEIDDYIEDDVYMVDPTFSMYRIDGTTIYYNSFRMAFVGYGTASSWSTK